MIQKAKQKTWVDGTGQEVPIQYIGATAKLKERNAAKLIKKGKQISEQLNAYKKLMVQLSLSIAKQQEKELNIKFNPTGIFICYNFDKSIKIEGKLTSKITFDDLTINACKQKLDEFIKTSIETKSEIMKNMIIDAFTTVRGKTDTKKVMSLLKYKDKEKNALFQEAMSLLEKSIERMNSKRYWTIYERNEEGEYKSINLNFSSVK